MEQNEKDRLQHMIDVMQAYKDGKEIEVLNLNYKASRWTLTQEPFWEWSNCDYRVKPEPQYRPFESAEEVMDAIKEHGLYLVSSSNSHNRLLVEEFNDTYIWCGAARGGAKISYYFEENYTFADGTPFGKLIEK